jgi:hypothetical protein
VTSRHLSRCDVTFSRLYTPCYSETKDVITSKWRPGPTQCCIAEEEEEEDDDDDDDEDDDDVWPRLAGSVAVMGETRNAYKVWRRFSCEVYLTKKGKSDKFDVRNMGYKDGDSGEIF